MAAVISQQSILFSRAALCLTLSLTHFIMEIEDCLLMRAENKGIMLMMRFIKRQAWLSVTLSLL